MFFSAYCFLRFNACWADFVMQDVCCTIAFESPSKSAEYVANFPNDGLYFV